MLKYFRGAPLKIYLYEYLTHEYFHTQQNFPIYDIRVAIPSCVYNKHTSKIQETNDRKWQVDSVSGNTPEMYTDIRCQAKLIMKL